DDLASAVVPPNRLLIKAKNVIKCSHTKRRIERSRTHTNPCLCSCHARYQQHGTRLSWDRCCKRDGALSDRGQSQAISTGDRDRACPLCHHCYLGGSEMSPTLPRIGNPESKLTQSPSLLSLCQKRV